ncbi:MAG: dihydroorotate dehydrogenase-like protein [Leptospirales bacterium]
MAMGKKMINLETKYMGLTLKSPLIMASSRLSSKIANTQKAEEYGAGAVILRSLFEEQIMAEIYKGEPDNIAEYHPEAADYYNNIAKDYSISKYFKLIEETKNAVEMPVLASIHCISKGQWIEYATRLENAGADGLELNLYITPDNPSQNSTDIEAHYLDIIKEVQSRVKIPVAVKLSPYFTNLYQMAEKIDKTGVSSIVLFNRYYTFDIDVDKMALTSGNLLSSEDENSTTLRWVSLIYGRIKADLSAGTGIHNAKTAIKQMLAGASTVQVASVLYKNDMKSLSEIVTGIGSWMQEKGFNYTEEFRGKLSKVQSKEPYSYERVQFIRQDMDVK